MDTERNNPATLPHDAAYKAICSHPKVVEDALRGYLGAPQGPLSAEVVNALDFSTLEKMPAEWVGRDFRSRRGDQVWRVRFRWAKDWRDPSGHLLVIVEFQSRPDPDMALRIATYALDLCRELRTHKVVGAGGPHPTLLPLVLHNGDRPWTAPTDLAALVALPGRGPSVDGGKPPAAGAESSANGRVPPADAGRLGPDLAPFQLGQRHFVLDFFAHREDDLVAGNVMSLLIALEQARSMEALAPLLRAMAEVPEEGLRRDLFQWMLLLAARHEIELPPIEELEKMASLDSFHSQLDKRMGQWTQEWFAQGRSEGVQQGLSEGIQKGRSEGLQQGRTEGRAEGVAEQRAMLAHLATVKFGPAAEGFGALLAEVGSSSTLVEIGEWLLRADTLGELAAKVRAGAGEATKH